ncbi:MAG TPA: hypothetical protein VEP90_19280 [Methylomirabilota bacterium]|nr:hypothetical protein [Methylomirabilota bacterium]
MNNPLKITSGEAEVYVSGSVVSYDEKPITIEFGSPPLKLILEFQNDNSGKAHFKAEDLGINTVKFTFLNTANVLGGGTTAPMRIGELDGKNLFFSFRAYRLNDTNQITLIYTLFKHGLVPTSLSPAAVEK